MPSLRSLESRMIRAAKLDIDLYEEVEADTTANRQALAAVFIASLAFAVGIGINNRWTDDDQNILIVVGSTLVASIIGWLIWSGLTYLIGVKIFKGPETSATYGELLRTIGFANSPAVLGFLVFIPYIGIFVDAGVSVWLIIAGVIAVRQALDFSTLRAIGTCIVSIIPYFALKEVLHWVLF